MQGVAAAVEHVYEDIFGFFDFQRFYSLVVRLLPEEAHAVEVGALFGQSVAYLIVEAINAGKKLRLDAVDKWPNIGTGYPYYQQACTGEFGNDSYQIFLQNMRRHGLLPFVNPVKGESAEVAQRYRDGSLDFVFVDAGHTEEDVARDLRAYFPKLKSDGIFAGHDYYDGHEDKYGVKAAVDKFFAGSYPLGRVGSVWFVRKNWGLGARTYPSADQLNEALRLKLEKRAVPPADIVHVMNLSSFGGREELVNAQRRALGSIEAADGEGVRRVACVCVRDRFEPSDGWERVELARDAGTQLGHKHDFPFVLDLFDAADARATEDGWLLYTNSDCMVTPDIYRHVSESDANVIQFHRLEVFSDVRCLDDARRLPRELHPWGIDGFALRASVYRRFRDVIPDMVIGAPEWDICMEAIARRSIHRVEDNVTDLFHCWHERRWQFSDVAGVYNARLKDAFLEADGERLLDERCDTAVVVSVFGGDPARVVAAKRAIDGLRAQDIPLHVIVVELVFEGQRTDFPELGKVPGVTHVVLSGEDCNRNLMQKECLNNIGASHADGADYLVFMDADLHTDDTGWIRAIRAKLMEPGGERKLVQGFSICRDTVDSELVFASFGQRYLGAGTNGMLSNPGMVWGMRRSFYKSMDGLNPWCIMGSGDGALVNEALNLGAQRYEQFLDRFAWWRKVRRQGAPKGLLDFVPVELVHEYHGSYRDRCYIWSRQVLDEVGRPIREYVEIDGQGLLSWKEPQGFERRVLSRKPEMKTEEDMRRVLSEERDRG